MQDACRSWGGLVEDVPVDGHDGCLGRVLKVKPYDGCNYD